MYNVRITASDVSNLNNEPLELLKKNGFDVKEKPFKNIKNEEEYIEFIKDADALLVGTETLDKKILEKIPNLKFIARRGVGYDSIDVDYCHINNITIARTLGTVESSVSELTMAFILALTRKLEEHSRDIHNGIWNKRLSSGLKGTTLGLVGFGNIGQEVARKASVFDMNLVYYCPHRKIELEERYNVRYVTLDELLKISDFVSLHMPSTEETKNMFTYDKFKKMKKTAMFINTARGSIVNEEDLALALKNRIISGAALDVFQEEPCLDSPVLKLDNVILSPHAGTFTYDTFYSMNLLAANLIVDYFNGVIDNKFII
ncbi:phosphoglycerate dehydrogenase [Clostridium cibarium]|uniref:Phosphoglycerate dehydrogenase n=1 Tax=Clostridium cibarium TaxID=2762247 RepID=A0ABR8PW74_9CLOT|nr:phosphoglycerate dehydrogenase [Clostridium cibarium]MBD7912384.1 phosphoglycerate dehydrogenase [Clostridium cibarium]